MAEPRTLNDKTSKYVVDAYCMIPLCILVEYAKIRPVQHAGMQKLKKMIATAGYDPNSVLKVRAPPGRDHVHWGFDKVGLHAAPDYEYDEEEWGEMLGGLTITGPGNRSSDEEAFMYGIIEGAHRFIALLSLVIDKDQPKYTLQFLVPCQVMSSDMPEELMIAIATREFVCLLTSYFSLKFRNNWF